MSAGRVDCGECPRTDGCVAGHCMKSAQRSSAAFEQFERHREAALHSIQKAADDLELQLQGSLWAVYGISVSQTSTGSGVKVSLDGHTFVLGPDTSAQLGQLLQLMASRITYAKGGGLPTRTESPEGQRGTTR